MPNKPFIIAFHSRGLSLPFIIAFHSLSLLPFMAFHCCLSLQPFITAFHSLGHQGTKAPRHQGTKAPRHSASVLLGQSWAELGHPTTARHGLLRTGLSYVVCELLYCLKVSRGLAAGLAVLYEGTSQVRPNHPTTQ